jgi:DnaJ-class molecular chaperone
MTTNFDPYKVLEVERNASADDIRKAFKQKSKTLHPDHGGMPEEFNDLRKAYEILTDSAKRGMWDEYRLADDLNIESEAMMVASQIAVQTLDTYPDNCNFDKEMSGVFEKCFRDIAGQIRDMTQKKERLEKRYRAIQKKPLDDFISRDIEQAVSSRDIQIRQQKLNLEIHKKAFELIKGYKFDIDKLSDFTNPFQWSNIGIWMSPAGSLGMWNT